MFGLCSNLIKIKAICLFRLNDSLHCFSFQKKIIIWQKLTPMPHSELVNQLKDELLPRFRFRIKMTPSEVFGTLHKASVEQTAVTGVFASDYAILKIPSWERHYWSPELQFQAFPETGNKENTIVRCVLDPTQSVWVLFMFLHAVIVLLTLFGGMFGLVQYQLENNSLFLWFWPFGIAAFIVVHIIARQGRLKARDQMLVLISFLIDNLEQNAPIEEYD
jgi:hypothetical protein